MLASSNKLMTLLLRSSFSVRTPRLLHVDSLFLLSSSQVLERSRDNLKIQNIKSFLSKHLNIFSSERKLYMEEAGLIRRAISFKSSTV